MKMTKIAFWRKVKENCEKNEIVPCIGIYDSELQTKPADPTHLEIAKMIRDNGYRCDNLKINGIALGCEKCPANPAKCGSGLSSATQDKKDIRKKEIDDYIALHETVKTDSIINSEPKPIRFDDPVPEYVYKVDLGVITCYALVNGFKKIIDKAKDNSICDKVSILAIPLNGGNSIWLDANNCYKTLDEAVAVALKKWGEK